MTNDPDQRQHKRAAGTPEPGLPETPPSAGSGDPLNAAEQVSIHPGSRQPSGDLATLREDIAALRELVEKRLSRDKVKEEAFDRLYEELDRVKRHAALLDNKSLYIDLILLYDRMNAACDLPTRETIEVVCSLRDGLKEILLRRDLHPISTGNERFDPRCQTAVSTETTVSPEEDGKVIRIIREGFACGDLIIRPQEVVVARFQPPTHEDHPSGPSKKGKEKS
jgi:molecular chaperone GrpE (heat shock protein)